VLYSSVGEIVQYPPEVIDTPMAHRCKNEGTYSVDEKHSAEDKIVSSVDPLYAQVNKKKKKEGNAIPIHTPVDQLYAQVDKRKKRNVGSTHFHTQEAETAVDKLYAQVNKKRKKGAWRHYSPPHTRGRNGCEPRW
jgi:hypothetical protein